MRGRVLIGACLVVFVAGCGGDSGQVVGHQSGDAGEARMSKAEIRKLPPLEVPRESGPPPHRFKVIELRKGFGPPVTHDDVVSIRFTEDTYPEARIGKQGGLSGGVVTHRNWWLPEASRGFQVGLPDMKVGGRRELIVPPKVAYPRWRPSWGYAPYVSIYVVDLLAARPGPR